MDFLFKALIVIMLGNGIGHGHQTELTIPPVVIVATKAQEKAQRKELHWEIYEASAYTADLESCGKTDGVTASGVSVAYGQVAMDKSIPFGTRVLIDGLGEFEVTDRGGAISKGKVDIYMPNRQQALDFGRHSVRLAVLPKN